MFCLMISKRLSIMCKLFNKRKHMTTKLYLKICVTMGFAMTMVGLVIPYLISQKSDITVLIGFVLMFATPFASYKAAKSIIHQLILFTAHSQR